MIVFIFQYLSLFSRIKPFTSGDMVVLPLGNSHSAEKKSNEIPLISQELFKSCLSVGQMKQRRKAKTRPGGSNILFKHLRAGLLFFLCEPREETFSRDDELDCL